MHARPGNGLKGLEPGHALVNVPTDIKPRSIFCQKFEVEVVILPSLGKVNINISYDPVNGKAAAVYTVSDLDLKLKSPNANFDQIIIRARYTGDSERTSKSVPFPLVR